MVNNLFLAAYPGAEDAARIARLAGDLNETHGLGGALRKVELLHVTLVNLTKQRAAANHYRKGNRGGDADRDACL